MASEAQKKGRKGDQRSSLVDEIILVAWVAWRRGTGNGTSLMWGTLGALGPHVRFLVFKLLLVIKANLNLNLKFRLQNNEKQKVFSLKN